MSKLLSRILVVFVLLTLLSVRAINSSDQSAKSQLQPAFESRSLTVDSTNDLRQFTAGGHVLGFWSGGMFLASGDHVLKVEFVNARPVSPRDVSGHTENPQGLPKPLGIVSYPHLWDRVTLRYEKSGSGVCKSTYDIEPAGTAGVDPTDQIRLRFNVRVKLDETGALLFSFETGEMKESRPVAWQEISGKRIPVDASFRITGEREVGFKVGSYDPRYPLAIDPVMSWNTFLGSTPDDLGQAIAVDTSGNVYVSGSSAATWGTPVRAYSGGNDAFVAKLNSSGVLQWNTFLGAATYDSGWGLAVDSDGNVYVTGQSTATWESPIRAFSGVQDAFVAKLNSSGVLQWNTFLGGLKSDAGRGVAEYKHGNVYVTGISDGTWGTPVNPFVGSGGFSDAFIARLDTSGALQWNTFLGSANDDFGFSIALDTAANIYLTGAGAATWGTPVRPFTGNSDVFVAKLNYSGGLLWNTFLGGASDDYGWALAIDSIGNIYLTGESSTTWGTPIRAYTGGLDSFVAKLNNSGALLWNTFLGSSDADSGAAIAVDSDGDIYVTGSSSATWGTPLKPFIGGYLQSDAFIAKMNGSGALQWNTFLGSGYTDIGTGIALDLGGNLYIGGRGYGTWGLPILPYVGNQDAFVAKFRGIQKKDCVGTWDGQGVYFKNFVTGTWTLLASPADLIACGDLYGDGKDDLIGIWPSQGGVWVKNSSNGSWTKLSSTGRSIAADDMNGDGRVDLLGTWDGQGVYYRDSVSGNWVLMATPADKVTAGDLDGDGKADLIGIWTGQAGVWVKYSKTGSWSHLGSSPRDIATGDMNGDGRLDLLGTWDGQGVYYRNSISGQWVLMASPADQIAAGDLDGDGKDDLIGIWAGQAGLWVKYSQTGNWSYIGSSARDIASGKMAGGIWSLGLNKMLKLEGPWGGYPEGPGPTKARDLSDEGPGGRFFSYQMQPNLKLSDVIPLNGRIPGPGEPGFRWTEQKNLRPHEVYTPKEKDKKSEKVASLRR